MRGAPSRFPPNALGFRPPICEHLPVATPPPNNHPAPNSKLDYPFAHTAKDGRDWEPLFTADCPTVRGQHCDDCETLAPSHGHLNKVAHWTAKFASPMFPPGSPNADLHTHLLAIQVLFEAAQRPCPWIPTTVRLLRIRIFGSQTPSPRPATNGLHRISKCWSARPERGAPARTSRAYELPPIELVNPS